MSPAPAPFSQRAELCRTALVIAGLGGVRPLLMKYCRSSAHAPATAGRGMAGAGRDGVKLLRRREEARWSAQRANAGSVVTRKRRTGAVRRGCAALCDAAGDVRAGRDEVRLLAAVRAGPAAGKVARSFALFAAVSSSLGQPLSPAASDPPLAVESERTFSDAPTVMTFLAVPGEPTSSRPDRRCRRRRR